MLTGYNVSVLRYEKITIVKLTHTFIWAVMAAAVFYILYSGITGKINLLTFTALGLIIVEVVVLLLNGWACPLTHVAQKVKPDWQDGDDLYLPIWLAIHNKTIFGTLFIIGTILVFFRIATQ